MGLCQGSLSFCLVSITCHVSSCRDMRMQVLDWAAAASNNFLLCCKYDSLLVMCFSAHCVNAPSRMAAQGFFGCKHYSKANELLAKEGLPGIDWCIGRV